MTTDENTQTVVERAWQEAESIFPWHTPHGIDPRDEPVRQWREGFDIGATFAATITPEQVEAVARVLYLQVRFAIEADWDTPGRESENIKDLYRMRARAMLRAAGFQIGADS